MASQTRSVDNTVSSEWDNPDNAFTENDLCTSSVTKNGNNIYNIINTPFTIPTGATIDGIEVKTVRGTDVDDYYSIELQDKTPAWQLKNGTPYLATCAGGAQETLGTPTDDWGGSWDAAHFNSSSFQVRIAFRTVAKGNTIHVDHIEVTIYYAFVATYEKTWQTDVLFKRLGIEKTVDVDVVIKRTDLIESRGIGAIFGSIWYCTLNGTIETTLINCDERGFDWGTEPATYTNDWTEIGSFGAGSFSHQITALIPGKTYYFRAKSHNPAGWGYGEEKTVFYVGVQTFEKTYQVDTLHKLLGIQKTLTVDAAIQLRNIQKSLSLDTLFALRTEKEAHLNAVFQRQYELQRQIDSLFKRFDIEKTSLIDILFQRRIQEVVNLDALHKKLDILKTLGVDTDFLREGIEKSFAIDAKFGAIATYEISRQMDALFTKLNIEQTFDIDTLIVLRSEVQRQIDTFIKKLDIEKTVDIDALLVLRLELQRGIDTIIQRLDIEKSFDLDALIVLRSELQRQVDTLLQKQGIEETFNLDTVFNRVFEKTIDIDVALLRENIEIQRQVDVLFRRLDILKSFDVDVTLIKENIVKSFAIDTRFGATQTYELSKQVDALFKQLGIEETVSIDTLLRRLDIEKTADVDTFFKRLGIPLTAAVNALLKGLGIERTTSVDTLFTEMGLKTISLDTIIVLRSQKIAIIDALLSKTISKQALIDAMLLAVTTLTVDVDTAFQKQGIELQGQVNAFLQRTVPADLLLDAVLKGVGVQRGFGLKTHFWIPWHDEIVVLQFSGKTVEMLFAKSEDIIELGDKEEEKAEFSQKKVKIKMGDREV